jgi:competence protein ComEC
MRIMFLDVVQGLAALVPHPGSGSSSTPAFLAAVRPAHAVFATGYRNRFGHPKAEVMARSVAAGAAAWRTDRDGTASRARHAAQR